MTALETREDDGGREAGESNKDGMGKYTVLKSLLTEEKIQEIRMWKQ